MLILNFLQKDEAQSNNIFMKIHIDSFAFSAMDVSWAFLKFPGQLGMVSIKDVVLLVLQISSDVNSLQMIAFF